MLDEIRFGFEHAGDQHLAVRQLDRFEQRPFMRVPRIGGLERNGVRPGAEHDVDDVGHRHVAVMRAFVIAPADMHAQLLGRNIGDGVIERLDVKLRALAELRQAEIGILNMPAHAEIGAVDLQDEACLGDDLIFVTHRIGDGVDVALEVLVVVVAEKQRHHAGRGGAHEAAGRLHARQRGFEIVGIDDWRLAVAHRNRRVAGRRLAPRAAGIAEHLFLKCREFVDVLIDEGVAGAAEAVEPVLDIGGVARLRHLAVIDQVDAGGGLLADEFRDRGFDPRGKRHRVDRNAFLLGVHHFDEVFGPGKAAGMRRQKAVAAAVHGWGSLVSRGAFGWRTVMQGGRGHHRGRSRVDRGPHDPYEPSKPALRDCDESS